MILRIRWGIQTYVLFIIIMNHGYTQNQVIAQAENQRYRCVGPICQGRRLLGKLWTIRLQTDCELTYYGFWVVCKLCAQQNRLCDINLQTKVATNTATNTATNNPVYTKTCAGTNTGTYAVANTSYSQKHQRMCKTIEIDNKHYYVAVGGFYPNPTGRFASARSFICFCKKKCIPALGWADVPFSQHAFVRQQLMGVRVRGPLQMYVPSQVDYFLRR